MRAFEHTIPENYKEVYHIDAADKKTGLLLTLGSLVIMVITAFICFIGKSRFFIKLMENIWVPYVLTIVGLIGYIVFHELVHGFAYKALTKQKLTFGLKWSCAFCGVPDIYCYRRTSLISLVAPLFTFTIIFVPLMVYTMLIESEYYIVFSIFFVMHISGCIGDIYMTYLLLTKFKDEKTLIKDTGPEQWIYMPKNNEM